MLDSSACYKYGKFNLFLIDLHFVRLIDFAFVVKVNSFQHNHNSSILLLHYCVKFIRETGLIKNQSNIEHATRLSDS